MFELDKMANYAGDNFIIKSNKILANLIDAMKKSLESITKWLKNQD